MSSSSSSTVVQTLTNYARGIFPDLVASQDPIISRMAPIVPTGSATGKYKNFSDKNAFQNAPTARAIGGPARRLEFLATDADYNCTPQALEIGIDDHERLQAGDMESQMEEGKIQTLLTSAAMSHVNDVVVAAKAGLSAAVTPNWTNASTCTPIDDIDAQIQAIADDIGMFPTDIIFGLSAWRRFRAAAQVKSSFPNAAVVGVTPEQAAGILLNPSIRIGVSTSIRDTAKVGAAKATANILGAEVFVFYAAPTPNTMDASFMKVFSTGRNSIESVRRYREERNRSDMLAVDWSRDIRVTSTVSARRLTVTVA
jgi:hypothetical protein